jgi:hypothetical protein
MGTGPTAKCLFGSPHLSESPRCVRELDHVRRTNRERAAFPCVLCWPALLPSLPASLALQRLGQLQLQLFGGGRLRPRLPAERLQLQLRLQLRLPAGRLRLRLLRGRLRLRLLVGPSPPSSSTPSSGLPVGLERQRRLAVRSRTPSGGLPLWLLAGLPPHQRPASLSSPQQRASLAPTARRALCALQRDTCSRLSPSDSTAPRWCGVSQMQSV